MAEDEIILFDLPSKAPCKCWSYNPWKTRMLLNYKGLNYRTEWLEYPQIRPRLEPHIPTPPTQHKYPQPTYTIPTIRLPDGTYVTDSSNILTAINNLHPAPALPADTPSSHLSRLLSHLTPFMSAFRPIYLASIAKNVLNEPSAEYFRRARGESVGMGLDEFEDKHGGETAYRGMEGPLRQITALLGEDESGPFFGGNAVTYPDFVWAGILIFVKKVGEGVFEEMVRRSGREEVHRRLLEAVKVWTERDDH